MTKANKNLVAEKKAFFLIGFDLMRGKKKGGGQWEWCHVVFSGFNEAARKFFPDLDPRDLVDEAMREGWIDKMLVKGGVMFKPLPVLLTTPTRDEKEAAARVREFIVKFIEEKKAPKAKAPKKHDPGKRHVLRGAARKAAEATAEELAKNGDFKGAMAALGYSVDAPAKT